MNNICIYKHTSPSGKVYIGQTSLKPENRWNNGRGYKTSPFIFNAINKYGWNNIQHEVLFTGLDQLNADIIEEDLIYYYKQIGKSYNLATGGKVNRGWKLSEESKKKLSEAHKGKKMSDEAKEKLRILSTGRTHSDETKEKMRLNNLGENNPNYGKSPSEEIREKISKARKGKGTKKVEQIDKNTLEVIRVWDSLSEVERQLNIPVTNISKVCKGKQKTAGGYKWRYKND